MSAAVALVNPKYHRNVGNAIRACCRKYNLSPYPRALRRHGPNKQGFGR